MQHGVRWAWRVGVEIVASMVIGLGAGFWLDQKLGTFPLLLLLFALFGLAAGLFNLKRVMELDREDRS